MSFSSALCRTTTHPTVVFDPRHAVYSVKGITSIPLIEDRARTILSSLSARNKADAHISLSPPSPQPDAPSVDVELLQASERTPAETLFSANSVMSPRNAKAGGTSPRVTFALEPSVKIMTPQTSNGFETLQEGKEDGAPPSPSSSVTSVASSAASASSKFSVNTDTVVKTLAARLSFWNRLSKRPLNADSSEQPGASNEPKEDAETSVGKDHARLSLDAMMKENNEEPAQIVESILQTAAPAPATQEEKRSELEDKVLREVIREYTKGGMYFAYAFGADCSLCTRTAQYRTILDITRSLQHKHDMIARSKIEQDQQAKAEDGTVGPIGEKVDVLAEPAPTLPLWRRVDRQFWWNEWLSKPFIDAGVIEMVRLCSSNTLI